nr:hypothetical protein [Mucilaginibacter sp. L294]
MGNQERIKHLEQLLAESLELLEDNKRSFALFNGQYYSQLKAKVEAYHNKNTAIFDNSVINTKEI